MKASTETSGPVGAQRRIATLACAMAAVVLLGACKVGEPDRTLLQREPGLYQGEADQTLDETQVEVLRQRARLQGGL